MFSFEQSGSFDNLARSLDRMRNINFASLLEQSGREGVRALSSATPKETGLASQSWYYSVNTYRRGFVLGWYNNDIEDGFPVVIAIQYGYSTGTGGYVAGRDFINPAMRPVFDSIINRLFEAVRIA